MAGTYQVIITAPAEQDLEDILNYLLEEASYQKAVSAQKAILDAIYSLTEMPTANGFVKELIGYTNNVYRRVIAKKTYKIIYQIEEQQKEVFVIRIMHVKRGPDFIKEALK